MRALARFGDLDVIELGPPAPVRSLVRAVLDTPDAGWSPDDGDKDEIAAFVTDLLVKQKGEMLNVYFGLRFDAAAETLETLPELLDHYVPDLRHLAMFLLRLAIQVDWTSEEGCFRTVARELAEFYMVREGSTTRDCLPKELREYAAGAAAESDRGRRSHVGGSGQQPQAESASGDAAAGASGGGEARDSGSSADGDGQGQVEGALDPSSSAKALDDASGPRQHGQAYSSAAAGKQSVEDNENVLAQNFSSSCEGGEWRWCVQHVLFPAMRYLVLPPRVSPPPPFCSMPARVSNNVKAPRWRLLASGPADGARECRCLRMMARWCSWCAHRNSTRCSSAAEVRLATKLPRMKP